MNRFMSLRPQVMPKKNRSGYDPGVERFRRYTRIRHVKLVGAQFLRRCGVRRALQETGCQSASNCDPLSASNTDPLEVSWPGAA